MKVDLTRIICITLILLTFGSCQSTTSQETADMPVSTDTFEQEKAAILATINEETAAAFSRDYAGWQDKWVHADYVSKTYINLAENSASESLGWEEIDGFVKEYFAAHPSPDPIPTLLNDVDVRLYGEGAWVSFVQNDAGRGHKRETRLMEKVDGQWKIAGMHTTIYGFAETAE